jgi:acetoin utilization deacetylase AcuC-like enzyme
VSAVSVRVVVISESRLLHRPPFEHPENPSRVERVVGALSARGIPYEEVSTRNVSASEREQLELASRIHARGYVEYLVRLSKSVPAVIDEDTYVSGGSLELALATLAESYLQALNTKNVVFLVSRPPGHHAGRGGKAMGASTQGFCILNNAAAAVLGFAERGFKRLAVLDFDAHHGNGTMEIFYRERVLQVDLHQDPDTLYPHTGYPEEMGEGEGFGYKVNLVLPMGSGDDLYLDLAKRVEELLEKYTPEALVVSAGFDAFLNDGLADLAATEISYYRLGEVIRSLRVPAVVVLEGGYSVGLERGVVSFIEGLLLAPKNYTVKTSTPRALFSKAISTAERVLEKASKRVLGA